MAIIKEADIKVRSVIDNLTPSGLPDGDPEITEAVASGFIHYTEDKLMLTYTENTDTGKVFSEITVESGKVSVTRHGAIESCMVFFEDGTPHDSLYEIPPYKFDVRVRARKIRCSLTKNGGALDIFYDMRIGGADKSVRMRLNVTTGTKTA